MYDDPPTPQRVDSERADAARTTLDARMTRTFDGGGFPVFVLATIALYTAAMGVLLLWPADLGAFGAFAEDFRVWCFGLNEESGRMETAAVLLLVVNPVVMGLFVLGIWFSPLKEALREPRRLALPLALALAVTSTASAAVYAVFGQANSVVPTLELDRLRTAYTLPEATLVDQEGTTFQLSELEGGIAVITSIYVTCPLACPMIMRQVSEVIDALSDEEKQRVTVLVITMNPEEDSVAVLARYMQSMRLDPATYRLATGSPEVVHRLLDRLGVERRFNEATGQIDHVNLFLVTDPSARIAWRFALGETQAPYMVDALRRLIDEERRLTAHQAP